jgi:excisionase family DNA binding protein
MTARFITVSAAAKKSGMSVKTLRRALCADLISGAMRTPGGHWRIPADSFDAWLTPKQTSAEKAAFENDLVTLRTIRDVCSTHPVVQKRRKRVEAMDRMMALISLFAERLPSATAELYEIASNRSTTPQSP